MTLLAQVSASCCLLVLLLAGCGTAPSHNRVRPPDWEDLEAGPTVVAASPALAPPASAPPTLPPSPSASAHTPVTPSASTHVAVGSWTPLLRWCRAHRLASPARLADGLLPTYRLRSANGLLVLRVGSRIAYWNGLELYLGFPPQMIDGQPYLQALDLEKNIQPLLCRAPGLGLGQHPVIVIDPGHGGENAGTRSVLDSHSEKDFTLDWARRLQAILAARGCRVFLTRSNDTDLALSNRVAFAEAHHADLFLSLHFNSAAPSRTEGGLETYCLTPAGLPSTLTRGFADDPALVFPNNAFDAQNLRLSVCVHHALLRASGQRDRGVRRARFPAVLRGQQCPAILIEGGYLSNPREARRIADPAYRQKLAEAIARAVLAESKVQSPKSEAGGAQSGIRLRPAEFVARFAAKQQAVWEFLSKNARLL